MCGKTIVARRRGSAQSGRDVRVVDNLALCGVVTPLIGTGSEDYFLGRWNLGGQFGADGSGPVGFIR